jgi:hypothetical protein
MEEKLRKRRWRTLHNEELHSLYSLLRIIRMMKSKMIWAGKLVGIRTRINSYRLVVGKPSGSDSEEQPHLIEECRLLGRYTIWLL